MAEGEVEMVQEDELFSLSDKPESISSQKALSYNVSHVYDIDEDSEGKNEPKKKRLSKTSCWNCGGADHALRQCPQPQNPREINKNRALFATRHEFKRYHVDLKDGKYPHLRPGVVSDKLREALGLTEDQLPVHIYRMRTLGYPPGWLIEAKADTSGIEMFDMDGNRVPNADEEEGEIGGDVKSEEYDESKIISYPGFNEWPPPDTLDETKLFGAPELKYLQNKEDFIKSLKNSPERVRFEKRVLQLPADIEAGECDMETEDIDQDLREIDTDDKRCLFIPPLPVEKPPSPPPEPLEEGEIQKARAATSEEAADAPSAEEASPPPSAEVIEENELSKLENSSHGRIVSIEMGTPVLKIHSPFRQLPPPEAFQKDISDVINFENLPDSTGAYEKLKDVLKNVREKMNKLKDVRLNSSF